MSNHTTITVPPVFAVSPVLSDWWIRTAVEERLAAYPYGYGPVDAADAASEVVATRTPGWIAAFLGQIEGCSNCGEPATSRGRCGKCQVLPSDVD